MRADEAAAPVISMRMSVAKHGPTCGVARSPDSSQLRKGQSRRCAAKVAGMLTDVVLPCLNESRSSPAGADQDAARVPADRCRPGPTTAPAKIAERHGAAVVHEPQRRLPAPPATAACSPPSARSSASWTRTGHSIRLTSRCVACPVLAGSADLVLGRRRPAARGAWPLHARLGNRAIASVVRRRTGAPLHDLGPMRAARRAGLVELGLADRRFGYPLEMVMRAAQAGGGSPSWTSPTFPVPESRRSPGR